MKSNIGKELRKTIDKLERVNYQIREEEARQQKLEEEEKFESQQLQRKKGKRMLWIFLGCLIVLLGMYVAGNKLDPHSKEQSTVTHKASSSSKKDSTSNNVKDSESKESSDSSDDNIKNIFAGQIYKYSYRATYKTDDNSVSYNFPDSKYSYIVFEPNKKGNKLVVLDGEVKALRARESEKRFLEAYNENPQYTGYYNWKKGILQISLSNILYDEDEPSEHQISLNEQGRQKFFKSITRMEIDENDRDLSEPISSITGEQKKPLELVPSDFTHGNYNVNVYFDIYLNRITDDNY